MFYIDSLHHYSQFQSIYFCLSVGHGARLLNWFSHCEIAICPKGHAICRRCSNLLRL